MPSRQQCLYFLLLLIIVAIAGTASAQQYHFQTYGELEGLLSEKVWDLAQAPDGSIWFATSRGLSRYDSTNWTEVGPTSESLRLKHVFVDFDEQGRVWTVGWDGSSHVFLGESGQWRKIPCPPEGGRLNGYPFHTLGRDPDGRAFLALANRHDVFIVYPNGQSLKRRITSPGVIINDAVFAEGRLFFATEDGLLVLDPADWEVRPTAITSVVKGVCPALGGQGLFVIGSDWVGRGQPDQLEMLGTDLPLRLDVTSSGTSAQADPSGGVYFGDLAKLYFFHPRYGLEELGPANGLRTHGATSFMIDFEGSVWVASLRGVSELVNHGVAGYDKRNGLFADEVSAILMRSNGQVVLGHLGGLTIMGDEPRQMDFRGDNPLLARVGDLAESPNHEVWFAATHLGVGHLKDDDTVEFLPNTNDRFRDTYALQFDKRGGLWIGSNMGLQYWDGEVASKVDLVGASGVKAALVRRLALAQDGSLLIVSGRLGLLRLRNDKVFRYKCARRDAGVSPYTVVETEPGEFLVGTAAGLYLAVGDSLCPAPAPWPKLDRPVYGITRDAQGRFWFGTDNGVMRWDGMNIFHLTNQDGLLGTETNRDALKLDSYGDLWVGTNRGLAVYREEFNQPALAPPLISFDGFEVDGIGYGVDEPLHLATPPLSLTALFHGVTFRDEARTTYLTWLENFEADWQGPAPSPRGTTRYTHVPAGRYTFHVQARAADGTLSAVAVSDEIVIMPPLNARWWFRLLLLGLALLLVGMVAYAWSNRRQAYRLEARVRARTRDLEQSRNDLQAETQRLSATLKSISDGVVVLDTRGRITMCNPAVERLLGEPADRLVGQALADVLPGNDDLVAPSQYPASHELIAGDGRRVWYETSTAPLKDANNAEVGRVLALRDITSRREVEDQRIRTQQLESLGVLAGGIAHDFNNLLTVILGNVSLVEEAPGIGGEERSQLNRIKAATGNARSLAEQFLTFAKGGDPDLKLVALDKIVRTTANLVFGSGRVTYELDLAPDLWPVEADSGQLSQVLTNLLTNARQAMVGSGTVKLRASNVPPETSGSVEKGWVSLAIHDSGEGISAENIEHIFDPYFSTREEGVGLGLAISHSIVRRHGGRLSVSSEVGRGTVFTLALPAAEATVAAAAAGAASDSLSGRALVLDDEVELLLLYERMLTSLGMSCTKARDGAEALRVYEEARKSGEDFAVVIMDLTIPGSMGGREAAEKLLARDANARIIVASGYSNDPVLANYRDYGFKGRLRKPFDLPSLRRVLQEILR